MERSEPSLVPEWLKSGGSVTGSGNSNHQFTSSSLHSGNFGLYLHVCFFCLVFLPLIKFVFVGILRRDNYSILILLNSKEQHHRTL